MVATATRPYGRSVERTARPSVLFAPAPRTFLQVGLIVIGVFVGLTVLDVAGQAVLWENAHWTAAGAVGAGYALLIARSATGEQRRVSSLLAYGLVAWFFGQLAWNVQTAVGHFSVPAPSDVGYLLIIPLTALPLYELVRCRLPRGEALAVYLDAIVICFALTTLILFTSAEALSGGDPAGTAVSLAYPILHLSIAAAGLVALLAVRVPLRSGGYLVLVGSAILGLAWVDWLRSAVSGLPPPGSLSNIGFSVGVVLIGVGSADWRLREVAGRRFERFASLALASLPLIAILTAAAVLIIRRMASDEMWPVGASALAVMILTGVRQTLLVYDRGRLLDSSRADRRELEVALAKRAEADSRYQTLVERVPAAVYIDVSDASITDGGRLAYMSPQIESILGYPPSAFVDDPELWPRLIHADDREVTLAAYAQHWATEQPIRLDYRMIAADGSVVWVHDEAYAMTDESGTRRVSQGLLVDTTEQKRLEAQLLHDALHDPLTGLANRVLFREHLDRALARSRRRRSRVGVLFLDVDDFKVVNDSLGHGAGDRLLVEVARRLSDTIRAEDVAARQGGDEFTILLERVASVGEATALADRLALALRRPIELEGRALVIEVSIGIALGTPGAAADDLLAHADAAMYAAKAQGKARHAVFDPSMRLRAQSRLEMEAELRAAIDAGAFELHYQPIVTVADGVITGFEALVRWRHPERGLIPPGEFIPLAEATGLIVPLGRWVTEQACRDLRGWRDRDPRRADLTISVNVSPRQAVEPGLVAEVKEALRAARLEPSSLVLEITESLTLHESATSDGSLRQLRDLGVQLEIDDFGTGFSALEYFKRFAVHGLKIDRSFVNGLGRSREDTAIVTATLAFASALGLSVTAEGVETADQLERLRVLGCQRAQGFLFARPMTADAVDRLLAEDPRLVRGGQAA